MDFVIDINKNRDIKILQLTDMQIIDATQRRYEDRLCAKDIAAFDPANKEAYAYSFMREIIKETNPDLIIITGDIIYGEFDDNGNLMREFVEFMDSFKIPWAPVFGNHDNESQMGIDWQCRQFEDAKYSIFARGDVFGNGNYSIGLRKNGELKRVVYMMDSNGCGDIGIEHGFAPDQLEWLESRARENKGVPAFLCFHIPTLDFLDAWISAGYQTKNDTETEFESYEIGKTVEAKNGDFGKKVGGWYDGKNRILPLLKECDIDGVFAGHVHKINTSVLYEGIRFTLGLKTGIYDSCDKEAIGGNADYSC